MQWLGFASLFLTLVLAFVGCSPKDEANVVVEVRNVDRLFPAATRIEVEASLNGVPAANSEPLLYPVVRDGRSFTLGLAFGWSDHLLTGSDDSAKLAVWMAALDDENCVLGYGNTTILLRGTGGTVQSCPEDQGGNCKAVEIVPVARWCNRPAILAISPTEIPSSATGSNQPAERQLTLHGVGLSAQSHVTVAGIEQSVRLIAPETLVIDDPTFPQFQRPGPVAVAVASPDDAPSVLCSAPARTDLLRVKPRQIQLASKPGSTEQRPPLHDFAVLNRPGDMPLMVLMEDDPPGLRLRLAGMDTTQVPWLPIHLPDKLVKLNATDSVRMSVVDSKSTVHEIVLLSPNGLSLVRLTLGVTAATVDLAEQPDVVGRDAVWIDGSQPGQKALLVLGDKLRAFARATTGSAPFQPDSSVEFPSDIESPCGATLLDSSLIVADRSSIHVLHREGTKYQKDWSQPLPIPGAKCPINADLVAADFDRDGKNDLAVNGASFLILNRMPAGAGDAPFEVRLHQSGMDIGPNFGGAAMTAADLNADGEMDLVWLVGQSNIWSLLNLGGARMSSDLKREGPFLFPTFTAGQTSRLLALDVDRDGTKDIVVGDAALKVVTDRPQSPTCLRGQTASSALVTKQPELQGLVPSIRGWTMRH